MGKRLTFECSGCGYTAEVSGKADSGMVASTRTVVCLDCAELHDVVVALHNEWVKDEDGVMWPKAVRARCPRSAKHRIEDWEGPGPCPKCRGRMSIGEVVVLWD